MHAPAAPRIALLPLAPATPSWRACSNSAQGGVDAPSGPAGEPPRASGESAELPLGPGTGRGRRRRRVFSQSTGASASEAQAGTSAGRLGSDNAYAGASEAASRPSGADSAYSGASRSSMRLNGALEQESRLSAAARAAAAAEAADLEGEDFYSNSDEDGDVPEGNFAAALAQFMAEHGTADAPEEGEGVEAATEAARAAAFLEELEQMDLDAELSGEEGEGGDEIDPAESSGDDGDNPDYGGGGVGAGAPTILDRGPPPGLRRQQHAASIADPHPERSGRGGPGALPERQVGSEGPSAQVGRAAARGGGSTSGRAAAAAAAPRGLNGGSHSWEDLAKSWADLGMVRAPSSAPSRESLAGAGDALRREAARQGLGQDQGLGQGLGQGRKQGEEQGRGRRPAQAHERDPAMPEWAYGPGGATAAAAVAAVQAGLAGLPAARAAAAAEAPAPVPVSEQRLVQARNRCPAFSPLSKGT